MFKESLAVAQNPHNLALLLQSYLRYPHTPDVKCLHITFSNSTVVQQLVQNLPEPPGTVTLCLVGSIFEMDDI